MKICRSVLELLPEDRQAWRSLWNVILAKWDRLAVCFHAVMMWSLKMSLPLRSHGDRQYNLLTPWSRVLLEKLTGFQLVRKFPAFYGTRKFITAHTSAPHLSLSWASSIQSIPPQPTSWRSILILSSRLSLGLPSGSFPQVSPPKPWIRLSYTPHTLHAPPISFFLILSP